MDSTVLVVADRVSSFVTQIPNVVNMMAVTVTTSRGCKTGLPRMAGIYIFYFLDSDE